MSDLKLVAPDQPTPLERLLLDAAAKEAPSAEQRARVRQALGLPALPVAPPTSPLRARRGLTLGKAALVLSGSAALVGLLFAVSRQPKSPPPSAAPVRSAPTVQALSQPLPEPVTVPQPAPVAARAPSTAPSTAKTASKAVTKAAPSPSLRPLTDDSTDLSEQLRLIEAARSAVASGNAGAAAQALASYSNKFPRGSFGQEAAVLRIETVDLQGNHTQAAQLARSFLAAHPNSPHVGLVKRIAGN